MNYIANKSEGQLGLTIAYMSIAVLLTLVVRLLCTAHLWL